MEEPTIKRTEHIMELQLGSLGPRDIGYHEVWRLRLFG